MFYISRCLVNVKKETNGKNFFFSNFTSIFNLYTSTSNLAVVRNVKHFTVFNTMMCNGLFTFYAA